MKILEQAYKDLEQRSLHEKYTHDLSKIFQSARDTLLAKSENELGKKAQFEIDFLNFNINDNKLSFSFSGTNDKGLPFEYPNINQFDEDEYQYLTERLKVTKSESLKARYSHILWLSPKKNVEYAQTAIDNYLKLIKIREKQDRKFPNEHYGSIVLESIKNVFLLSMSVKYKIDKTKNEIIRIVNHYPQESTYSNNIRYQLIELMLSNKTVFKIDDFNGLTSICEQMYLSYYSSSKHSAIDVLELIVKIEKKIKNDTKPYERRIAELWEDLSIEREDTINLVSTDFCKNAITIYKKLKDTKKVKELEKRFNELRKNIKLSEFNQEIDLTDVMKKFRKYADKLTNNTSFDIIHILMTDKFLLPTYEEVKIIAAKNKNDSFLSEIANLSIIDRNGNTAQHFNEKEESQYFKILRSYQLSLEVSKSKLIHEIMIAGIKKGKLNATTFLSFLQQNSWLGKELEMSSNGSKPIPYCWLALIAPALNEYFVNVEFYFRNPVNYPNFILCIDSLSLKIEGILRDICEFKGVITFELKPDKKGRIISQEKDIHKLLYEPELVDLIDEDDLLFFKFLLIEKAGYNLRHRVAHSLMTFYEYPIDLMNLLLIAILKLGKYNFVQKQNDIK